MALFTIRVELHGATREDYDSLASNLASLGITDIIRDDNGTRYRMPPAEYNFEGTASRAQVVEATKSATARVGRRYAVFVSECSGRTWEGLQTI